MSDKITKDTPDSRSFEERVFARFDALDARLDGFDARLDGFGARLDDFNERLRVLEVQAEQRGLDTKPIWERALAEILELRGLLMDLAARVGELADGLTGVKKQLSNVERKLDVLSRDIIQVRADQVDLDRRVERLEPKTTQ
ncbi:MAG TPA: hypothetical protein VJH03_21780 [Blastocatellia bacterium]|nr:hypothetical protein [Blastocatellia bacterium]